MQPERCPSFSESAVLAVSIRQDLANIGIIAGAASAVGEMLGTALEAPLEVAPELLVKNQPQPGPPETQTARASYYPYLVSPKTLKNTL
jgi:hypothetical protein